MCAARVSECDCVYAFYRERNSVGRNVRTTHTRTEERCRCKTKNPNEQQQKCSREVHGKISREYLYNFPTINLFIWLDGELSLKMGGATNPYTECASVRSFSSASYAATSHSVCARLSFFCSFHSMCFQSNSTFVRIDARMCVCVCAWSCGLAMCARDECQEGDVCLYVCSRASYLLHSIPFFVWPTNTCAYCARARHSDSHKRRFVASSLSCVDFIYL